MKHTWVSGRHDGPEQEAVSEVEISPELPSDFHQCHAAIHDRAGDQKRQLHISAVH